jgi:hypothetical protein
VVVANPAKTRAIAEAKVKTDKVDARSSPSCWPPTTCRRCGGRRRDPRAAPPGQPARAHRRQRTRLKNRCTAILHRNLVPRCPAADLFGRKGRAWLAEQALPADERQAAEALLRQLDFLIVPESPGSGGASGATGRSSGGDGLTR